jgi:mono/diheme cytochrome c family protein
MSDFFDHSARATNGGFVGVLAVAGCLIGFQPAVAQESGKQTFQQSCSACHSIGGGRGVGPDLAGVTARRSEDWLIPYIKSADTVFKSGDPAARANRAEYKMPMPDQSLSDGQIKAVLAHIREAGAGSAGAKETPAQAAVPASAPTPEDIRLGRHLFEGNVRLAKGGPACNACHDVNDPEVMGGGVLASNLTQSFSRMGRDGVSAMLGNAPFPLMQVAYEGKPLDPAEVRALVGFLQQADKEHASRQPAAWGWTMFLGGCAGTALLFGLFSLFGARRKKQSVNQDIYDRQAKSE